MRAQGDCYYQDKDTQGSLEEMETYTTTQSEEQLGISLRIS